MIIDYFAINNNNNPTKKMDQVLISGSSFKEFIGDMRFYKLTSEDEKERMTHKLQDGLNEIPMKQTHNYVSEGIKFFEEDQILGAMRFAHNAKYIREVLLVDDSIIYVDKGEYITDKLFLNERMPIEDYEQWDDPEFCQKALKLDSKFLKYIKNPDETTLLTMVMSSPSSIEHIINQTEMLQKCAVSKSPWTLRHCINPTLEVCELIPINELYNFRFAKNISVEVTTELLKNRPKILEYIDNQTYEMCYNAIKSDATVIRYAKVLSQELCDYAYSVDKNAFKHIPSGFRSYEMCLDAVQYNGMFLDDVPKVHMNNEIAFVAILNKSSAIKFVLNPTEEMCYLSLKDNALNIAHIDNPTDEMYLLAAAQNPYYYQKIKDKSIIDDKICLIRTNPESIADMPDAPYEYYVEAVKKSWKCMKYMPEKYQTEEFCIPIVTNNPEVMEFIINQTPLLCDIAVSKNGLSLKHIHFNNITETLCYSAVLSVAIALEFVPEEFQTELVIYTALNKNVNCFKHIITKTIELCEYSFNKDKYVFSQIVEFFPEGLSDQMVNAALERNGMFISHLKETQQTIERCKIAIKANPFCFKHIIKQTIELSMFALKLNPRILSEINVQTLEMCLYAVGRDALAVRDFNTNAADVFIMATFINPHCVYYIENYQIKRECMDIIDEIKSRANLVY